MAKKRGRKPLERTDLHARVAPGTPGALSEKAQALGFAYGKGGATGELLDAIAAGYFVLIPQEDWEKINNLVTSFKAIEV